MAPAGTPVEVIQRLNLEIVRILRIADVRDTRAAQGLEAQSSTPAELAKELRDDIARYAKLLRDAGVQPQ